MLAEGHLTFPDLSLPEARMTPESTSEDMVSAGALRLELEKGRCHKFQNLIRRAPGLVLGVSGLHV